MSKLLIRNARVVNRGAISHRDILIENERIVKISPLIDDNAEIEIDATGQFLMPGIIDDQVHFREPGLTHKATIGTESAAAAAGGVTSYMEMPNTRPPALTQEELQKKYDIAAQTSTVNYSFYMGASNDNLEEVLKTNPADVCGIKIFMGSSTGNMLVDDPNTLEGIFSSSGMLIATHCEDEDTIRRNLAAAEEKYGRNMDASMHPVIRNAEGCYLSSSMAADLARRHGARLHILHISTEKEIGLFKNSIPLEEKNITSEVCVHHLTFDHGDYATLGNKIKCNPAIKYPSDKAALLQALKDEIFDVVATDHAPHTVDEKAQHFLEAPSGLPLIQHSLSMMLAFYHSGDLSLEFIVKKMCHDPARLFRVRNRGFVDEGFHADLVLVDPDRTWTVDKSNILYKCGWSPLEGRTMKGQVLKTIVNGKVVYEDGRLTGVKAGKRLLFNHAR